LDATSPRDTGEQLGLHVCTHTSLSLYTGFTSHSSSLHSRPDANHEYCRRIASDEYEEMLYCSGSPAPLSHWLTASHSSALLECRTKSAALRCSSA
jgi:hypothetical protein